MAITAITEWYGGYIESAMIINYPFNYSKTKKDSFKSLNQNFFKNKKGYI